MSGSSVLFGLFQFLLFNKVPRHFLRSAKAALYVTVDVLKNLCLVYGVRVQKLPAEKSLSKVSYLWSLLKAFFPQDSDDVIHQMLIRLYPKDDDEAKIGEDDLLRQCLDEMDKEEKAGFENLLVDKKDVAAEKKVIASIRGVSAGEFNATPQACRDLIPPGAVIVRVKTITTYEGCHRGVNKHRWVARKWAGVQKQRSETTSLKEVVMWLWDSHREAGFDCANCPDLAKIQKAVDQMQPAPSAPAPPTAAAGAAPAVATVGRKRGR
jgi:hypothetical protein